MKFNLNTNQFKYFSNISITGLNIICLEKLSNNFIKYITIAGGINIGLNMLNVLIAKTSRLTIISYHVHIRTYMITHV